MNIILLLHESHESSCNRTAPDSLKATYYCGERREWD